MTIKNTLDTVEQRLETMLTIPEEDRTPYIKGQITAFVWCRDLITASINAILPNPSVNDALEYDDDEDDLYLGQHSGSMLRPARYGQSVCSSPHHEHAYLLHMPERNFKQCKYCLDVQRMTHGEKIGYGRRSRKS